MSRKPYDAFELLYPLTPFIVLLMLVLSGTKEVTDYLILIALVLCTMFAHIYRKDN